MFEPIDWYQGKKQDRVSVLWTAYVLDEHDERIATAEVNGLSVNEQNIGQRYGILVQRTDSEPYFPFNSEAIVPLNPDGQVAMRSQGFEGALVFGELGTPFKELVNSEDATDS